MNSSSQSILTRRVQLVVLTSLLLLCLATAPEAARADNSSLHFQRPGSAREQSERANKNFRRPGLGRESHEQPEVRKAATPKATTPKALRVAKSATKKRTTAKRTTAKQTTVEQIAVAAKAVRKSQLVRKQKTVQHDRRVVAASGERMQYDTQLTTGLQLASHGCDICDGPCSCEPSCGMYEPGCGIAGPSCGIAEPSCGIYEPGCGISEPGCGIGEPSCGCGDVGCGGGVGCDSCVALPGPDYWCFPVCLPKFKDLSVWGGVQGFRGPRDFANGRSDSNFGFHQGINVSGRAPLLGLLFPQLSYQLGYQAVQSRLNGTATSTEDRSQQFVTAGFFRRVNTGIQFGLVWDMLQDDLDTDIDLHQLRYEVSLKSPQGREIGFFGTNSTNDALSSFGAVPVLTLYETVDQYALFIRWVFGNGYESRLWGGATNDGEGLFGGEFNAPLSSRWTVQSGFNYLITDQPNGLTGVSEESWNIGINLVWHLGKTARRGYRSPYRPMFAVADNGWMFVDRVK